MRFQTHSPEGIHTPTTWQSCMLMETDRQWKKCYLWEGTQLKCSVSAPIFLNLLF